ncbi:MAG: hypothetical protein QM784_00660 [Polyangiaceae bacterium]
MRDGDDIEGEAHPVIQSALCQGETEAHPSRDTDGNQTAQRFAGRSPDGNA